MLVRKDVRGPAGGARDRVVTALIREGLGSSSCSKYEDSKLRKEEEGKGSRNASASYLDTIVRRVARSCNTSEYAVAPIHDNKGFVRCLET